MSLKARLRRFARRRLLSILDGAGGFDERRVAELARRLGMVELNVKAFGYDLARRLADALPPAEGTEARPVGLRSKPSTQADLESDWARHWIAELKAPMIFHRKMWELAYVLQAIFEQGHMAAGAKGLGFGCGVEPIASYLASRGVAATITDLPLETAQAAGWASTDQHAGTLDQAFHPHLVDRATFDRLVTLRIVDMNAVPPDLEGYDFCWSICALEHLGSIEQGVAFVERAMASLRPGGLAVHTMEYDVDPDGPTFDNAPTVLFQRRHIEALAERLRAKGHDVAPLDFDVGSRPLDRFIDVPPWTYEMPPDLARLMGEPAHLKIGFEGYVMTCFGLVVTKAKDG